jgi:C_GCAxxG_C_C family probable redox protein
MKVFLARKNVAEAAVDDAAQQVAVEAENLFRSGKMHCAEAVLAAVQRRFAPEVSEDVVRLASGFGNGSGAGCICGAIAGGTMALGLVMDGDRKGAAALTARLQQWFKQEFGATCCKTLTSNGKKGCVNLTASAAGKVAELILER